MHWSSQKCLEVMIISTGMSCIKAVCGHCIYLIFFQKHSRILYDRFDPVYLRLNWLMNKQYSAVQVYSNHDWLLRPLFKCKWHGPIISQIQIKPLNQPSWWIFFQIDHSSSCLYQIQHWGFIFWFSNDRFKEYNWTNVWTFIYPTKIFNEYHCFFIQSATHKMVQLNGAII